jgi:hypothetical protein
MAITETERSKWLDAEYPYDMAKCGNCAILHRQNCIDSPHSGMVIDARNLPELCAVKTTNKSFRAAVLKFRKKWAKFYPGE